jgi:hypothetical protein
MTNKEDLKLYRDAFLIVATSFMVFFACAWMYKTFAGQEIICNQNPTANGCQKK